MVDVEFRAYFGRHIARTLWCTDPSPTVDSAEILSYQIRSEQRADECREIYECGPREHVVERPLVSCEFDAHATLTVRPSNDGNNVWIAPLKLLSQRNARHCLP